MLINIILHYFLYLKAPTVSPDTMETHPTQGDDHERTVGDIPRHAHADRAGRLQARWLKNRQGDPHSPRACGPSSAGGCFFPRSCSPGSRCAWSATWRGSARRRWPWVERCARFRSVSCLAGPLVPRRLQGGVFGTPARQLSHRRRCGLSFAIPSHAGSAARPVCLLTPPVVLECGPS